MRKLLVPLDGSALAEAAIPVADHLSSATGAEIVLVTVGELPETTDQAKESHAALSGVLDRAARRLERPARRRVEHANDPAAGILHAVQEEGADMVVMTTHGRSGITEIAHGSVAADVIRSTNVPVTLVRP
jgi:nucleotide-binding universal stress UspA family protein